MKRLILPLFLFACTFCSAQNAVLKFFPAAAVPTGGNANVHDLIKGYIGPLQEDFGMAICNGWFTTPVLHKRWGFDFNATVTTVTVNSSAKSFQAPALSGLSSTGVNPLPSAYGESGTFPTFTYSAGANSGMTFRGPDGANVTKDLPIGSLAIPTLQAGLGVFKDTDLRVRFSPAVNLYGVEFKNWGVAAMHDFKRFLPFFIEKSVSLSLFAGYSQMTVSTDLSGIYAGSGQQGIAKSSGITTQVLIGKEFKFFTLFAGVGYNFVKSNYEINGSYNVTTADGNLLTSPVMLNNPFSDSHSASSVRSTAGMRLRLGPVTINGDYTFLNTRSLLTAGFGFTIR
jgi:hypothetical protein